MLYMSQDQETTIPIMMDLLKSNLQSTVLELDKEMILLRKQSGLRLDLEPTKLEVF